MIERVCGSAQSERNADGLEGTLKGATGRARVTMSLHQEPHWTFCYIVHHFLKIFYNMHIADEYFPVKEKDL